MMCWLWGLRRRPSFDLVEYFWYFEIRNSAKGISIEIGVLNTSCGSGNEDWRPETGEGVDDAQFRKPAKEQQE